MRVVAGVFTSLTREAIIGDCIKSLNWADEIIVLSNMQGSDRTLEVARQASEAPLFQLVRYDAPLESILGPRNMILEAAGDQGWLVHIDTDERLVLNGLDVRAALALVPAEINVVDVMMTSGEQIKPMFFRLPFRGRWKGHCHEYIDHPLFVMPSIRYWDIEKTQEQIKARTLIDIPHLLDQHKDEPKNPRWMAMLGESFALLKDHGQAATWYAKAANEATGNMAAWYCVKTAAHLHDQGFFDAALQSACLALAAIPLMPEAHCLAASCCMSRGRFRDAISWTSMAMVSFDRGRVGPCSPKCHYELPYEMMAKAMKELGEDPSNLEVTIAKLKNQREDYTQRGIAIWQGSPV